MGDQEAVVQARRRPVAGRLVLLLVFAAAAAALCYVNRASVPIRPFGHAPLYQLLLAACAAGLVVGWSLSARFTGWRLRRGRKAPSEAASASRQPDA